MENGNQKCCTAFQGFQRIASGQLANVALKTKEVIDRGEHEAVLIFDDVTGDQIEVDFRGTSQDVLRRVETTSQTTAAAAPADPERIAPRGPGRPKLGVVAREVTLLPRHWNWLNSQPGGASVALRKLVEVARRMNATKDSVRQSQDAAYRFMSAMAGNLPGFEEATRALFAGHRERFAQQIETWPVDVREHARKLATIAFHEVSAEL